MRWTPRRKAEVIISIEKRLITVEEAKALFELSNEELSTWTHDYVSYGVAGLRVTKHPPELEGGSRVLFPIHLSSTCKSLATN